MKKYILLSLFLITVSGLAVSQEKEPPLQLLCVDHLTYESSAGSSVSLSTFSFSNGAVVYVKYFHKAFGGTPEIHLRNLCADDNYERILKKVLSVARGEVKEAKVDINKKAWATVKIINP